MTDATRPTFERIAFVFDFDGTLAVDSYDHLLERVGQDPETFRRERIEPMMAAGWQGNLARLFALEQLGVDEDTLAEAGRTIELLPGVPEIFDVLEKHVQNRVEGVDVELYLLSAALDTLIRACPIADRFDRIWACRCAFDRERRVVGAMKTVEHAEKARYLLQIARGMSEVDGNPPDPYGPIAEDELHVPLNQMVFVGDGLSDMPAFALMADRGGVGLALAKDDRWKMRDEVDTHHRVDNVLTADYRDGSALRRALLLAADSVTARIALRGLSRAG